MDQKINTVNCSFNNMSRLPDEVIHRTEQLIVNGNNLGVLETLNDNLTHVNVFNLERSDISYVTEEAMKMFLSKANVLSLAHNKMKSSPRSVAENKTQTQLWLGDNPYDCNCHMMWMRDWLLNATNVMDKDNFKCAAGKYKGTCSSSTNNLVLV